MLLHANTLSFCLHRRVAASPRLAFGLSPRSGGTLSLETEHQKLFTHSK